MKALVNALTPTYLRTGAFIMGCVAVPAWFASSYFVIVVGAVLWALASWLLREAKCIESAALAESADGEP